MKIECNRNTNIQNHNTNWTHHCMHSTTQNNSKIIKNWKLYFVHRIAGQCLPNSYLLRNNPDVSLMLEYVKGQRLNSNHHHYHHRRRPRATHWSNDLRSDPLLLPCHLGRPWRTSGEVQNRVCEHRRRWNTNGMHTSYSMFEKASLLLLLIVRDRDLKQPEL